ncbi:MAG: hypothetical protein H6658_02095 [Ardenticatenaceae bacterium]|nr:hypothetical protein [Ardenticatenaceae bacterium]
MNSLPGSIRKRVQRTAVATMPDTCQRLQRGSPTTDAHGKKVYVYTAVGSEQPCGIRPPSSREVAGDAVIADYIVRLPHDMTLSRYDRLRLLSRHGELLNPALDGDIIGEIEHGPTAQVVKLKVIPYGN